MNDNDGKNLSEAVTDFATSKLKDKQISPEMVAAIAELINSIS